MEFGLAPANIKSGLVTSAVKSMCTPNPGLPHCSYREGVTRSETALVKSWYHYLTMDMGIFRASLILDVILIQMYCLHFVSSFGFFTFLRMGNFTSSTAGGLSSTACAQYVQEVVSQNCVVIFSKTTCPYCKMAKNVFNEIGATYKVVELDEHNDGRRLQEALARMTGARTVPRVFVNGNCIGGGSDTKQLHQQGRLVPLIEQCAPCCSAEGSGSGQFESAK